MRQKAGATGRVRLKIEPLPRSARVFPAPASYPLPLSAASGCKGVFRHPDGVITRGLDADASRSGRAADPRVIPQSGKGRRFRKGRRFPIFIAIEPLRSVRKLEEANQNGSFVKII